MTFYDVYVAELEDGELPKELPKRESPFFETCGMLDGAFARVIDSIKSGKYQGGMVDQCAWAARVTKDQLLAFLEDEYGDDPPEDVAGFIRGLPSTREYCLVASEL